MSGVLPNDLRLRVSLRTKWVLFALLLGLGPLVALALLSVRIQRRGLEQAERELGVAVVDQAAEAVERSLDDAAEATHRVGRLLTEGKITSEDARLELSQETLARAVVLAHVAIYTPEGKLIDAITRAGEERKPEPLAAVPEGLSEKEGRWLAVEFEGGVAELRYAEALVRGGTRRGWVVGTLKPRALDELLQDLSRRRYEQADRVVLVDAERRVIAGGAPGSSLASKDIFAALGARAAVAQKLALTSEYPGEQGPMVGTLRTLPERGWMLVTRRPEAEAYRALGGAQQASLIAALAVGALAAALGAFFATRTTRPIRALVGLTHAYAARRFGERAEVQTGDELQALGESMSRMADELQRSDAELAKRARAQADLSRFLPEAVAEAVASGFHHVALGGERREISVLFADVVAFTRFAEEAPPERVSAFLNELFTILTEVIFRHGGTVDKFLGDSVMAIFGAPTPQDDHAQRALLVAEDMHRFVSASAPAWRESYGIDVQLAIGVNSGEAVVGNLGSESRMEYTAIGDTVNVAARLESVARPGQTLLTEAVTRRCAGQGFSFTSLGQHPLRGKSRAVEVFQLDA
jgi:class 3 adenylate cyclase